MKAEWGNMILDGVKTLEIRGNRCIKHNGKRVGLAFSGTSAIYGFMDIMGNVYYPCCVRISTWRLRGVLRVYYPCCVVCTLRATVRA